MKFGFASLYSLGFIRNHALRRVTAGNDDIRFILAPARARRATIERPLSTHHSPGSQSETPQDCQLLRTQFPTNTEFGADSQTHLGRLRGAQVIDSLIDQALVNLLRIESLIECDVRFTDPSCVGLTFLLLLLEDQPDSLALLGRET